MMEPERGVLDSRGKTRVQSTYEGIESMTIQSDAHQADIQNILETFKVGGIPQLNEVEAKYLDVSEMDDYVDVMRIAADAEVQFLRLPSKVREIFDHDVAVWLDTAHDEDKRDALVAAGFLQAEEASAVAGDPGPKGETPPADAEGVGGTKTPE